jgi:hypothetical protein
MEVYRFRIELRRLTAKGLLEIAFKQKEKNCAFGGLCRYKIIYRGAGFCVSELLGKGCETEFLRKLPTEEDAEKKCQGSGGSFQQQMGWGFSTG